MKRLCLGTFLRVLCDAKLQTQRQYSLINDILSTVKHESRYDEPKFQNALLSGKNNLTDYTDILTCDKNALIADFESIIKPYFNEEGQRLVIICLRDVLKEDSSIQDSDDIGFENDGYTKQDIISKQVFPFSELIANVYYFCCTQVENRPFINEIKEIKDYTNKQMSRINEVQLETECTYVHSKVKLTLQPHPFDQVFTEVKNTKLALSNTNDLKFFMLDVVNSKIDYENLQRYILNNIGNYIYCRGKRNRYRLPEDSYSLAMDAFRAYKKRVNTDPTSNHFNEIMLYSFLECVLGAPKIFSKMELQDHNGIYESSSSGVHILTLKQGGKLINQLVFGATDTVDSLESAVDNAFNQVVNIKSKMTDEFNLVKEDVLSCKFDSETNEALENILLPQKNSGIDKPDSAFGIFLGYTVNIEDEQNNQQFKLDLVAQMEKDIENIASYIEDKIMELGLDNYSFYIYVLPFNNAIADKESIMKNALEVD